MRIEHLVSMANDIGNVLQRGAGQGRSRRGVANHVRRFWDPRMRREIIAHYQKGGAGLDEVPRTAIGLLAQE